MAQDDGRIRLANRGKEDTGQDARTIRAPTHSSLAKHPHEKALTKTRQDPADRRGWHAGSPEFPLPRRHTRQSNRRGHRPTTFRPMNLGICGGLCLPKLASKPSVVFRRSCCFPSTSEGEAIQLTFSAELITCSGGLLRVVHVDILALGSQSGCVLRPRPSWNRLLIIAYRTSSYGALRPPSAHRVRLWHVYCGVVSIHSPVGRFVTTTSQFRK